MINGDRRHCLRIGVHGRELRPYAAGRVHSLGVARHCRVCRYLRTRGHRYVLEFSSRRDVRLDQAETSA